jgi:hypothetical protein
VDAGSTNTVIGRTSITVNGKLRATGANTPSYPTTGTPPTVTGANALVQPAFPTPAACPGCAKLPCTQRTPVAAPPGCLMPCPQCGNGVVDLPAEDCDPGNGDRCVPGHECDIHCRSLPANCADGQACTDPSCDQTFGCVSTPSADGTTCEDGRFCTSGDTCRLGVCTGGPTTSCDDGNPCTIDAQCDPKTDSCVHTPVVCTPDPTNHCYVIPACSPATGCPAATLVVCPNPGDVCNPADGSCGPQPCGAGLPPCDDRNPCTSNVCSSGHCAYPPLQDGTSCDDATLCNGRETCQSGVCAAGTPPTCDDSNVCTADSCNPIQGCQNPPIPGCCVQPSDCGGNLTCVSCVDNTCGVIPNCCITDADCDDGNDCTDDQCGPMNRCVYNAIDGDSCGDICNPGTCSVGTCNSAPVVCMSDNDPCTDDFCDPNAAGPDPCVHRHKDGCCQTALDCDDHNTCTTDTCDHMLCLNTLISPDCQSCTTDQDCAPDLPGSAGGACAGKRCQAGICTDVAPPNCDTVFPGFPGKCILDGAGDPSCACPSDAACDDHNACNGKESCSASGACVPGTPLDCDDHDLCTDDTCTPTGGCPHAQKTGYDGVRCHLDTMDQALGAAKPTDITPGVKRKISGLIIKVRAKLTAGESAGPGKRAVKQVAAAGKQLKAIGAAVRKAMHGKKKIDPMLGSVLANAATGGSAAVDSLKASLLTP